MNIEQYIATFLNMDDPFTRSAVGMAGAVLLVTTAALVLQYVWRFIARCFAKKKPQATRRY